MDDFDAFTEKLRGHLDVELVHPPMTHAWQQRVVRLYDPDWHMIEVGESMEHIALRLLDEGRSVEGNRRSHPSPELILWSNAERV
mgnify:CR=1 FL=1